MDNIEEYKDKAVKVLSNDKLAYVMVFLLIIILVVSGVYLYYSDVDSDIIDSDIINNNDEPSVQMNILETENGIKVDVVKAGTNIDSILLEYNNVKKIYNVSEDIEYNKGDGSYKIYYITESDELKLYDNYTRIQLEDSEEYI